MATECNNQSYTGFHTCRKKKKKYVIKNIVGLTDKTGIRIVN